MAKKKPKEDPRANDPISRKHVKNGKFLIKGVKRFMRYNDDLISDADKEKIAETQAEFIAVMENSATTRKEFGDSAKKLNDTCEKSVKGHKNSAIKENIESFFVVIVLVMAVRIFFAQPFKIPTGSMQPTLNGVIAYPAAGFAGPNDEYAAPEFYETPGLGKKIFDKLWYGRTHVKWVADRDLFLDKSKDGYQQGGFYFTKTTLWSTDRKSKFTAPGTIARIDDLINWRYDSAKGGYFFKKGEVIAQGYVDTGDQVFVDRFTYHWRAPKRGEVFVFNTRGITGIERSPTFDPRGGSQHYIKRLVGVPGDQVTVEPPNLLIDGKIAEEFGMQRVMSQEGHYQPGYTHGSQMNVKLDDEEYWAMGDNSDSSFDSRGWGVVPEKNIVGRGMFVFLPFGHHFGPVR